MTLSGPPGKTPGDEGAYWGYPMEALWSSLQSSAEGLNPEEATTRKAGTGALNAHKTYSVSRLIIAQLSSPLMVILLVGALTALGVGDWVNAAIVIMIVAISSLVSATYESRASRAVEALSQQVAHRAWVRRGGKRLEIFATDVVPGDVLLLDAGSLVAADGRVFAACDCFASQGLMTGETFPVPKCPGELAQHASLAERSNCVFAGTSIRSGTAQVLVVRTGEQTEFGKIAQTLGKHAPRTEFEQGLRQFGGMLVRVMLAVAVLTFAVNLILQRPVLDSLMFAVALCVGLSPELLPAILGITLAKGAQRMASHGVIVRRLDAMENLGSMDVLCTDKTGTLTRAMVMLDAALDVDGGQSDALLGLAFENAGLQAGMRNALDDAVIKAARNRSLSLTGMEKLGEIPYDFTRKRLSVLTRGTGDTISRLVTKGALDEVLEVCQAVERAGITSPLDATERVRIQTRYTQWSEQGYRVLGVATRSMGGAVDCVRADESGMTLRGFLLLCDPPEPGVRQTLTALAALGVSVKIITGDNPLVTRHVAEAVGLGSTRLLTGASLGGMNDDTLLQEVERTTLFAQMDPGQKERVIQALRRGRHVVGFLGDGINDAPALHSADVGISVDTAADVAREAADFVLMRHDLNVLIEGIKEGRRTFANTLKYIYIVSSANFGNMLSMACASAVLPFLPLLAKQVLLNNFLSDIPALGLAGDEVDPEWAAAPHRWDLARIQRFMVVFGLLSSAFDLCTFLTLYLFTTMEPSGFRTAWFVESLITQIMTIFIVRTARPLTRSRPARMLLIAAIAVAALTGWLPYSWFAPWFGFVPLPWPILLAMLGLSLGYAVTAEGAKHLFYKLQRTGLWC